jgi:hypothetical protein
MQLISGISNMLSKLMPVIVMFIHPISAINVVNYMSVSGYAVITAFAYAYMA